MNCRDWGSVGFGTCPVPFIDCAKNSELSDLFDLCFLENGPHFLNGRPLLKQSAAVATSQEGQPGQRGKSRPCNRPTSCLGANSLNWKLTPVALPRGRAMLATRPRLTGSSVTLKTMGRLAVAAFAASAAGVPMATI